MEKLSFRTFLHSLIHGALSLVCLLMPFLTMSQGLISEDLEELRKKAIVRHGSMVDLKLKEERLTETELNEQISQALEQVHLTQPKSQQIPLSLKGWERLNQFESSQGSSCPMKDRLRIYQCMVDLGAYLDRWDLIGQALDWGATKTYNQGFFLWGGLFSFRARDAYWKGDYTSKGSQAWIFGAKCLYESGREEAARNEYMAMTLSPVISGDPGAMAMIQSDLGNIESYRGNTAKAIRQWQLALTGFEKKKMLKNKSDTHIQIGREYLDLESLDSAMYHFSESKRIMNNQYGSTVFGVIEMYIGEVHRKQHDHEKAFEAFQRGVELTESRGDHFMKAQILEKLANAEGLLFDYEAAIAHANQALELFRKVGAIKYQRRAEMTLLGIELLAGNYEEGLRELEDNQVDQNDSTQAYFVKVVFMIEKLAEMGKTQTAVEWCDAGIKKAEEIGELKLKFLILNMKGELLLGRKDPSQQLKGVSEAEECFLSAAEFFKQEVDSIGWSKALCNLGFSSILNGQFEEAYDFFEHSIRIDTSLGDIMQLSKSYIGIGTAAAFQGDTANCFNYYRKALDASETMFLGVRGERGIAQLSRIYSKSFGLIMEFLAIFNADKIAYDIMKRSKGRYLDILMKERELSRLDLPDSLLDQRTELLQNIETALEYQNKLAGSLDKQTAIDLTHSLNDLRLWEARVRSTFPEYGRTIEQSDIPLHEFQAALEPDEAVVEYLSIGYMYGLVITRDKIDLLLLGKEETINQEIRGIRNDYIEKSIQAYNKSDLRTIEKLKTVFQEHAYNLYFSLWRPITRLPYMDGIRKVSIIPDRQLWYLPFEMFIKDSRIKPYHEYRYLIEDYDFRYYPSSKSLYQFRTNKTTKNYDHEWVGVGLDDFSGSRCAGVLNNLVGNESSLQKIAVQYPKGSARVMTGKEASEESLKGLGKSSARILHISSHALFNQQNPELCKVVLKEGGGEDGCLHLFEVLDLSVEPETVVLAGCETGMGKNFQGEGMAGMLRGFQYRKAQTILLSLWQLDASSTYGFFEKVYRKKGKGKNGKLLRSIRAAKEEMIGKEATANPFLWAGMIIYGEG